MISANLDPGFTPRTSRRSRTAQSPAAPSGVPLASESPKPGRSTSSAAPARDRLAGAPSDRRHSRSRTPALPWYDKPRHHYEPSRPQSAPALARQFVETISAAITTASFDGRTFETGNDALTSLIAGQHLITPVHQFIADHLHQRGIPATHIGFELKLETPFAGKDVDVVATPEGRGGVLDERVIAIGCRSAISSVSKNDKNTFAVCRNDATDLHERHPAQVVGHVQVIMLQEVDREAAKQNTLAWKPSSKAIRTLRWWNHQASRVQSSDPHQLMEAVAVVLIDPDHNGRVKLHTSMKSLIKDGWVAQDDVEGLSDSLFSMDDFTDKLLTVHAGRFPAA